MIQNLEKILLFAGLPILIAGLILWVYTLKAPDSIKNGREFILEYHKVSGNPITKTSGRFIFAFPWWPIKNKNTQITFHYALEFRRFWFLMDSLYWAQLADSKSKGRGFEFYSMAFAQLIYMLLGLGGVVAITAGLTGLMSKLWIGYGVFSLLLSLGFKVFPWFVIHKRSIPVIRKTKYSDNDKKTLVRIIRLSYILAIIAAIYDLIRIALEIAKNYDD